MNKGNFQAATEFYAPEGGWFAEVSTAPAAPEGGWFAEFNAAPTTPEDPPPILGGLFGEAIMAPSPGTTNNPLATARNYIKRGWNPVPVSRRTKKPFEKAWQKLRATEKTVTSRFSKAVNVGVQMGPMSGGLTDIDLDCREAMMAAPMLLPESNNVFGRVSKPCSHWLYRTTLADKIAKAGLQFKDVDDSMMLELRIGGGGKGSQSVFPGSVHESGEAIEWGRDGTPTTIDDDELSGRVHGLAAVVMLARHWPAEGSRHDAALTVGGFLARIGLPEDVVMLMLEAITTAAGDEQAADRVQAGRDAIKQYNNGGETRGLPKLVETFGEKVANKVAEWLGYQGDYKPANGLPELVVGHEPTAVAKDLAKLIAQGEHYFFNGNAPVRIAIEANNMPRAIEVTPENVRVLAHEISNPVKRTNQGIKPAEIKPDVAKIYLNGLEGRWGLKHFAGIATTPILNDDGTIRSVKPERQLVGRNELDDGSGSGPTGRILAIPLITGTTTDFSAKAAGGTSNQLHLRSHR